MVQDVPTKSHDSKDMHRMEGVLEMMETEREIEEIQGLTSDDDESVNESTRTVATNTTG